MTPTVVGWAVAGGLLLWAAIAVPAAVVVGRAIAYATRAGDREPFDVFQENP